MSLRAVQTTVIGRQDGRRVLMDLAKEIYMNIRINIYLKIHFYTYFTVLPDEIPVVFLLKQEKIPLQPLFCVV